MAKRKKNLTPKYQPWVDARKRFHLSHAHIQMARELGMNPKRFGGKANHKQEPWKAPLPEFIEILYFKRFGKERPANRADGSRQEGETSRAFTEYATTRRNESA